MARRKTAQPACRAWVFPVTPMHAHISARAVSRPDISGTQWSSFVVGFPPPSRERLNGIRSKEDLIIPVHLPEKRNGLFAFRCI
jgi:hypothetical protein